MDALQCLLSMVDKPEGRNRLIQSSVVQRLCGIPLTDKFPYTSEAIERMQQILCYLLCDPKRTAVLASAADVVRAFQFLAQTLVAQQGKAKFASCASLLFAINAVRATYAESSTAMQKLCKDATWAQRARAGLQALLTNRLPHDVRRTAILLAASVIELLGINWALSGEQAQVLFLRALLVRF
jgi:hypothetical protein